VVSLLALLFLALPGAVDRAAQERSGRSDTERNRARRSSAGLAGLSDAFESLAERTRPAVVSVVAEGLAFGGPGRRGNGQTVRSRQSMGSGVIVDSTGYVLTNAHLVQGARSVRVALHRRSPSDYPGESILKPEGRMRNARVVGIDRETDLAVLRMEGSGFPCLPLSDSDELNAGELVFAFGNPLGLETSVSMGVVSSVARQLEPEDPMIYIQTDAAINPGSSGGPLVNTEGEIVGINTLILSQSGGSQGIGFAAPSNIVEYVYREIREYGHVRRGVIGVYAQTITPTLAAGLSLPRSWGVVLADVYPGGPADRAGLRPGDIVLSLNGEPMENGRQFDVNVYPFGPGDTVRVEVLRTGRSRTVPVPVIRRPNDLERISELVDPGENVVAELGILALELREEVRRLLPRLRRESGVVVAARTGGGDPGGRPDEGLRLQVGDVIHAINRLEVHNLVELRTAVGAIGPGEAAVATVERQGQLRYVPLEVRR